MRITLPSFWPSTPLPHQTNKINRWFLFVCLSISACDNSDPSSQSFDELAPSWEVQFDSSTRRLGASGAIFTNRIQSDLVEGDVRLTGGDRLQIRSNDRSWILYRRESDFVYRRAFDLPQDIEQTELRFDTKNNRIPSNVIGINHIALPITQLAQESQSLPPSSTLQLTWQLPGEEAVAGSTLTEQQILVDIVCLLYTSPSPRDRQKSRMPSSA